MVVYGRSGTGKTTFAASAPKPMLYLDVKDEGTDSISDISGIDVLQCEDVEEVEEAYWWLVKNPGKYKSIVIDTCTQLQGMIVAEVMKENGRKGRPGEWGSMRKQDWGDVSAQLKDLLLNFRDLSSKGVNVIFIAQDRTFNGGDDEDSQSDMITPEVGPAMSPSVAKTLNASVSVVVNTFIREREIIKEEKGKKTKKRVIEYCVGVGPSSVYTRKIRKPKSTPPPEFIVDCDFEDIIELTKG